MGLFLDFLGDQGAMSAQLRPAWLEDLNDLADRCVGAKADDAPDLLRSLYAICHAGPPAMCRGFGTQLHEGEFDRLLSCGAVEAAALRMIKPGQYTMSGGGTRPIVAVSLIYYGQEVRFGANCEEVALIGAAATALLHESRRR